MKLVTHIEDLDLEPYLKSLEEDVKRRVVTNAFKERKRTDEIMSTIRKELW